MERKRVGVILSGCGVYDGSEIQETVLILLALAKREAVAVCLAPNQSQMHVVNHLTGELASGETRNVLEESARIARGAVTDLKSAEAASLDALILPGGFGAAKNLCDFATKGAECVVLPEVERLMMEMRQANKPIGVACIAPVIAAKVFGALGPELTIGDDPETAAAMERMGARHTVCPASGYHVDAALKLVSTPAYMNATGINEAAQGIDGMVAAVLHLTGVTEGSRLRVEGE
ncbi:MAG: isoprenoid biosynthesis glyoxalase ElbB [Verrucomicrobiota bacterium]|nr:isoprenoid biosynthesis glyoxalase ElbB [Verrucomicrobiota bacterium]